MSKVTGVIVEPGFVSGKAVVIEDVTFNIETSSRSISTWKEIMRLDRAIETSKRELRIIQDNREFSISLGEDAILEAQIMMLDDLYFIDEIKKIIKTGKTAEYAVNSVKIALLSTFEQIEDAHLRTRKNDVIDLADRIIANLLYTPRVDFSSLEEDTIIVAKDLPPSITASLDKRYIKGVILESGSKHSHTGILLTSKGIPALFNVKNAINHAKNTESPILLNSDEGEVDFSPTKETLNKANKHHKKAPVELSKETFSKDGVKIQVSANVSIKSTVDAAVKYKADGVGLMRTEFMYMNRQDFPKEDDENKVYKSVVQALDDVTFRLLDIGGDKFLPYHPKELLDEMNPALGTRGIRFLQLHEDVMRQQIRAILRASEFGHVKIIVPMVAAIEEFLWVKEILKEEKVRLEIEKDIPLGVMIETPASAIHVDMFAKHADFLSIGTNDLIQFLLAFDRTSSNFDIFAESMHPSIFKVIRNVVMSGKKHNIPVSLCGALAQNIDALPILLGLGIRHISVEPNRIGTVKEKIMNVKLKQYRQLRTLINRIDTEDELIQLSRKLEQST